MFYTWILLMVLFIVIEGATLSLVTIWFAFGALIAALLSFAFGADIQIMAFVLVSCVTLFLTRPLAKKWLQKEHQPTNLDRVIGKTAIVQTPISRDKLGTVKIDGKVWTASADKKISANAKVKVLAIDGVKLKVELKEEK